MKGISTYLNTRITGLLNHRPTRLFFPTIELLLWGFSLYFMFQNERMWLLTSVWAFWLEVIVDLYQPSNATVERLTGERTLFLWGSINSSWFNCPVPSLEWATANHSNLCHNSPRCSLRVRPNIFTNISEKNPYITL